MSKFSDDLGKDLVEKVNYYVEEANLTNFVDVRAVRLGSSKKDYGVILKSTAFAEIFTKDPDRIVIAIYEDLFDQFDDDTQSMLIEGLVSQISHNSEKEKVVIQKPEINVPLGMYQKYGDEYVKKLETAVLTIAQMVEQEKERKGKK